MGKVKKSTKKFLKSKLKDEIDNRKKRKEATKYMKKKAEKVPDVVEETVESESEDDDIAGFANDQVEEDEDDMSDVSEDDALLEDEDDEEEEELPDQEAYKKELEELKLKDPKFYEYLQENDQELLKFGESDEEDEEDEEMEQDDRQKVTREMIHAWRTSLSKNHSIKTLKKVLMAFKTCACFGDTEQTDNLIYQVEEGKIFNLVLLTAIKYAPIVFDFHLYGENEQKGLPSAQKKWKKVQSICKSFLTNLLKFIKKMTSLSMTRFVVKSSEACVGYFACFPKLGKDYLKQMLDMWANAEEEQVRIVAFLCVRRLAIKAPNPYLDLTIKGAYQTFLTSCRATSAHSWTHIQFMDNCIVELCGLSLNASYQHMFVNLRQLALQIRTASTTKTKESYKSVYNWQFLHALRLWGHLVIRYCDPEVQDSKDISILKPLIYPLVQIMVGAIRLKPSSKHFPLRLAIIRILIEIAQKTKFFIPVASYLFEVFESSELKKKGKPSTLKPIDFKLNIRAPNPYLGTKSYHNGLIEQVVHLLFQYYSGCAFSIAFPELAIPAIIQLKRMTKQGKDFALNKQIQQLVDKLEQNSKFIEAKRSTVAFGPKDTTQAIEFLSDINPSESPLYKYNESRLKTLERQAPKDMMVAEGDDTDSEQEEESQPKQAKKDKKTKEYDEDDLDDDLVEDFELSDEE
ncbi:Nucleolar Complex 2 protein [Boothiomyces sp. JEL0838]|nr:Nucleolar Complex 2 protein [Boothiomyces sp. JEL0838]KAJ3313491.1 Nucleolar Complex 2 protein [Boothiomyces sp. JEL0838]